MVFYFTCSDPRYIVYMGKDKYENEGLIKWGWPEDIWFHVENLSSAHVYLRMPFGETDIHQIPDVIIQEMAQLTKANSIEGSKDSSVDIIYTPWFNLKKTFDMDVGQVSTHNPKLVLRKRNVCRERDVLRVLEKTKTENFPDLEEERQERDAREVQEKKKALKEQRAKERDESVQKEEERRLRSYESLQQHIADPSDMAKGDGSIQSCRELEEDFM
eukprot:GHVQ01020975.1.p1 GENE.GHVQ01020975.1~~GHVQ01020975.1.p1  ORF type:complete len:216 (+),score=38.71 GHVQ01020975.1:230-877(+)